MEAEECRPTTSSAVRSRSAYASTAGQMIGGGGGGEVAVRRRGRRSGG